MENLHNLHFFCINGIAHCEFQTKITLCFHAQCTNHSVIKQKLRMLIHTYSIGHRYPFCTPSDAVFFIGIKIFRSNQFSFVSILTAPSYLFTV